MPYDKSLAEKIRISLAHLPNVEEKKMFGGIAFMVNDKMCINVGKNGIMCRIDPALHKEAIRDEGCHPVVMRGREYVGWIRVADAGMNTDEKLDHWVNLALDFNGRAKPAKRREPSIR
jgi:TfoX/Sxy family transcriptional regulator of competence genes